MSTIHTIDLNYLGTRGAIAAYVVVGPGGPVVVETGPASTIETLRGGLAALGFAPGDVRHVLVTHIHFDHAGASGWMARQGARIHVHELGRRHLIDPSRLVSSARRIYGDEMERRWGRMLPVPESKVTPLHDGDAVEVEGLKFRVLETPGHARHHHAYVLDAGDERIAFTGDAAASYVKECPDFISLPTPPPEFELGSWLASVERLERERLDAIYPTHFGRVDDPARHLARVKRSLRAHADFVRRLLARGLPEDRMQDEYTDWFAGQAEIAGMPEDKMGFYVRDTLADMNLVGLVRYWEKVVSG